MPIWDIVTTHGNNRTKNMRTKTLLIAAAAMAVGVATSMAQTTYSQNIVGYANVPTSTAGNYYMVTVPFTMGVSNGVNEVFGTTLPDFSEVITYDVPSQSYNIALYDSTQPTPGTSWYQSDDNTPLTTLPKVPVGAGFFLLPAGALTNTFAGSIPTAPGNSTNQVLSTAGNYYMVGSQIPYAGFVTNSSLNMVGLPDFTEVLTYDVPSQSYVIALYDSTQPTPGDSWYLSDDNTPGPCPTVSVGQGFFVLPAGSYTWTQTLNP